jgi:hypothetical protein
MNLSTGLDELILGILLLIQLLNFFGIEPEDQWLLKKWWKRKKK